MLITNTELASSIAGTSSQLLPKNCLAYKILLVYLEIYLLEKFNFNLGYILTGASNPDNQDNTLYRAFYLKLMNILWSDNFLTANSRDKLWGFVPRRTASGQWQIRANILSGLCLNQQKDCAGIGLFFYVTNNGMYDP